MTLTVEDRLAIADLVNRHGHLTDAGDLDAYRELFTKDVVYDVSDLGYGALHGLETVIRTGRALGDANPLAHHVTNVVVTEHADGARALSKGLSIATSGAVGSVTYDDVVVRTDEGWRISRRTVTARREPLKA
ncbi:nuclear transport factor 2 family protein [Cryptosporangium japonicum]|uniref:Nuclear transport factor 2 family protein n=1 Tax=Cryptosporangium japonicum TaxID=80872 RepID=A0ABN0UR19_9ACTN